MIAQLKPQQKIEWASTQRKQGNRLFAEGDFQEAMDVYLTCLVAIDTSNQEENTPPRNLECEVKIQLPVLLNLALCSIKLGMLSKAEKFCNYAIELKSGQQSIKAYFRRGKVRMLQGNYVCAEIDLDKALELLQKSHRGASFDEVQLEKEKQVILREKQKLHQLIKHADNNEQAQQKAMKRLFESSNPIKDLKQAPETDDTEQLTQQGTSTDSGGSLYPEKKIRTRNYSTLRDDSTWDQSLLIDGVSNDDEVASHPLKFYVEWYFRIIRRSVQNLFRMIGDKDNLPTSEDSITLGFTEEKTCKVA